MCYLYGVLVNGGDELMSLRLRFFFSTATFRYTLRRRVLFTVAGGFALAYPFGSGLQFALFYLS